MRNVTCRCDTSFEADLPDEIDLDAERGRLDEILDGSFFSLTCPSCGAILKPELEVSFRSKAGGLAFKVLPEIDRLAFQLGQIALPKGYEVLIGYAELYERARILKDGLDPETMEIIKYYLRLKAEDSAPDAVELSVSYSGYLEGSDRQKLAFHIAGMKEGEVALVPIGMDYYRKIAADKARTRKSEPFDLILKGPYKSVRVLESPAE